MPTAKSCIGIARTLTDAPVAGALHHVRGAGGLVTASWYVIILAADHQSPVAGQFVGVSASCPRKRAESLPPEDSVRAEKAGECRDTPAVGLRERGVKSTSRRSRWLKGRQTWSSLWSLSVSLKFTVTILSFMRFPSKKLPLGSNSGVVARRDVGWIPTR